MPEHRFQLIVGLGNPGEAYRLTRHNVGYMVVDRLALRHGISLDKQRFKSVFGSGKVDGRHVILAKPMTFMNLSGPSVRDLAISFDLDTEKVLVIHDDIDVVFGKIKIKEKGGDGGHNGVRSLIVAWGSDEFVRIRIGIGRPQTDNDVSAYVLGRFDAEQEKQLSAVISTAEHAVKTVLFEGVSEAMNRFHGKTISERNVGRRL
ncbi:MAG: aminoacyl-tRNA hydrolase [Deltaproteobacteria bacterium]|nr:aminoacyl-tRNA hydrolase [Deltaproteobacteria bacterium]